MNHDSFYRLPEVYEIAFSYRDVARECDFLTDVYRYVRGSGEAPGAVLELACGPGDHAREFHRRGLRVAALDLSPEMTEYVRGRLGSDAQVLTADMTSFTLRQPVDLAFTLIDSLPYLTTNEQLVAHFRSVRDAVNPGGVYVVELRHPGDIWFSGADGRSTVNTWTMERGDLKVTTEWGVSTTYDPIAQTERVLTRITVERGDHKDVIESSGQLRPLLPQELLALADLAGGWRFAGWWGDFALDRPLGASSRDWRMIVAFQAR